MNSENENENEEERNYHGAISSYFPSDFIEHEHLKKNSFNKKLYRCFHYQTNVNGARW